MGILNVHSLLLRKSYRCILFNGAAGCSGVCGPPLLDLGRADLAQLVHLSGSTGDNAFSNLDDATDGGAVADGIGDGLGLDTNNANAGVVLGAVVLAVAEVTKPGLQRWTVGLLDEVPVGNYAGLAGYGGPVAGAIDEGDVDMRVTRDLVRLVRLSIGVEKKVNTTGFLCTNEHD